MTPLPILHHDEFLVAIDKPAGMAVHPARTGEGEPVAMKRLRDELGVRVHPVHRLDQPTSGVLLFALDGKTAGVAQQAFERRRVVKRYLAIVPGRAEEEWRCDAPVEGGEAETHFRRIGFRRAAGLELSLLRVTPVTGRRHQIRRHLLEAGLPIAGDFRYAGEERSHEVGRMLGTGTRMLLQAESLEMEHPRRGGRLTIVAPVDAEFLKCFPAEVFSRR